MMIGIGMRQSQFQCVSHISGDDGRHIPIGHLLRQRFDIGRADTARAGDDDACSQRQQCVEDRSQVFVGRDADDERPPIVMEDIAQRRR